MIVDRFSSAESESTRRLRMFVAALEKSVARSKDAQTITADVRDVLLDTVRDREFVLPRRFQRPVPSGYARRLLHRSERLHYSVVAMVWAPGQGTPLHDHAGMWCVEAVACGEVDVTQYERTQVRGTRYRFERTGVERAGVGQAGLLIPPREYHTIANPGLVPAITLHVYAGEMESCSIYLPYDDGWYRRQDRVLSYDD